MARDAAIIAAVDVEIVNEYLSHGFVSEEIEAVEAAAQEIQSIKRSTARNIIEAGARLTQIKDATKHGDWQYFVEYRCQLSMDSAQRFMAAFAAISQYPMLADHAENIASSALYLIGQSKHVTPEVVQQVVEMAADGEVSREDVMPLIAAVTPDKPEKKAGKLGFEPLSQAKGKASRDQALQITNQIWGSVAAAGLNPAALGKNRDFKAFAAECAKGGSDNDTARLVYGFLMAMFVFDYSADHGVDK